MAEINPHTDQASLKQSQRKVDCLGRPGTEGQELDAGFSVAESARRLQSEFLARLSHEIRTPLNGLMVTVDLLSGSSLDAEQSRYMEIIRESSSSLMSVIDEILDLSQMEADSTIHDGDREGGAESLKDPVSEEKKTDPPGGEPSGRLSKLVNMFAGFPVSILLVEDNEINRKVAMALLRKLGLEAHAVSDGLQALSVLEERKCDLVLMDLQMPGMDGIETTRRIRSSDKILNAEIPVIALTAQATPENIEKCRLAGFNDFLSKPILPEKLSNAISLCLGRGEVEDREPRVYSQAFDREDLLERLMGDEDLMHKILKSFFEKLPETLDSIKRAFNEKDENLPRLIHSLKGSAANISAGHLKNSAEKFEEHIDDPGALHQLQRSAEFFRTYIQPYINPQTP